MVTDDALRARRKGTSYSFHIPLALSESGSTFLGWALSSEDGAGRAEQLPGWWWGERESDTTMWSQSFNGLHSILPLPNPSRSPLLAVTCAGLSMYPTTRWVGISALSLHTTFYSCPTECRLLFYVHSHLGNVSSRSDSSPTQRDSHLAKHEMNNLDSLFTIIVRWRNGFDELRGPFWEWVIPFSTISTLFSLFQPTLKTRGLIILRNGMTQMWSV